MAILPRFPRYQLVVNEPDEEVWMSIVKRFPIVEYIVRNPRGRFARLFTEKVLKVVKRHQATIGKKEAEIRLNELLDDAFNAIHSRVLDKKLKFDALYEQMVAVSYTNVRKYDQQPPKKKARLEVGTSGLHGHFADLIDESPTDIYLSRDGFHKESPDDTSPSWIENTSPWEVKCSLPAIDEDVLLGGKSRSAYFENDVHYSTRWIFEETRKHDDHGNTEAPSNDYRPFENMVAHAIFCSSRRYGVQGIPFNDFMPCFVGEFQAKKWEKMPLKLVVEEENTTREILASDLLQGYSSLVEKLSVGNVIPFLAPPNAEWPESILQANEQGCNFGHLVRPDNKERCGVYVQNKGGVPLFFCECNYHDDSVDISKIQGIMKEMSKYDNWPWEMIFVFCRKFATFPSDWAAEYLSIGCVKINCKDANVTWIHNPEDQNREQLVIVMEIPECNV
ncbi:unnamed protein product [Aphanomyces euteiches]